MKIRSGFVSNSSSSSFCIYGTCISNDDSNGKKILKKNIKKALKLGLEEFGDESVGLYIGREWSNIGLDETGRQFMEDVDNKLKEAGIISDTGTIEEAWYPY